MSVETVTPTEAEKSVAAVIVGSMSDVELQRVLNRDIAQALAEQRAEIVGRYEALADELDRLRPKDRDKHPYAAGSNDAAIRIRSVAR